jgi:hypothetical protein
LNLDKKGIEFNLEGEVLKDLDWNEKIEFLSNYNQKIKKIFKETEEKIKKVFERNNYIDLIKLINFELNKLRYIKKYLIIIIRYIKKYLIIIIRYIKIF